MMITFKFNYICFTFTMPYMALTWRPTALVLCWARSLTIHSGSTAETVAVAVSSAVIK